jgi:hypothetical protein
VADGRPGPSSPVMTKTLKPIPTDSLSRVRGGNLEPSCPPEYKYIPVRR